jgi:hypothetical protein
MGNRVDAIDASTFVASIFDTYARRNGVRESRLVRVRRPRSFRDNDSAVVAV